MKSSAGKIALTGLNDLFRTGGETVQEVPLSELFPFKDHPFHVRDDDAMRKTVESIARSGVLAPGIVRPRQEGGYEIIAGHRRKRGSELAGRETMPVLIRELDDDEATIIMVDSNLQREKILPSEKAFAYKMKLEALKHQGKRHDLTLALVVPKLPARDKIAQDAGEKSGMAITRYIALTKLISPLLVLVDEEKLSLTSAADYISDLTDQEQRILVSVMDKLGVIPTRSQLVKIREQRKTEVLTITAIETLLSTDRPSAVQVIFKQARLHQYFPQSYTARQMEEVIVSLLEAWSVQQGA
ncbi:Nucleoid occlusion protein [Firmicutes bacterium ASF500]|nr:Nucleoid occlusion protein [Firmicutes bacterium ASF500]